ncbi:MAG TPA: redoxin domain-containing protein [Candidatus Polarisedimenticolia bacterium]|nr:redoxin domain-containing protein [Candidatus Polarisedimenticolia bacterium]
MEADSSARPRPLLRFAILAAAALILIIAGFQAWRAVQAARLRAATERLRTMYFTGDYEGARQEGADLVRRFPQSMELLAWYFVAGGSRKGYGDDDGKLKVARRMTRDHPNDPWGWFALAGTESLLRTSDEQGNEALAASAKALALRPHHPDFIWMRAWSLLLSMDHAGEVPEFVDAHLREVPDPAELLVVKAQALFLLGTQIRANEEQVAAAYATLEEARRRDPGNYHARFLHGVYLSHQGEPEKGLQLLKNAVALAPDSVAAHKAYWEAFNMLEPSLQQHERAAVLADLKVLEAESGRPWGLARAAEQYGALGMRDKQVALEDKLLREHGEDPIGKTVLYHRITRLSQAIDLYGTRRRPPDQGQPGPIQAPPDPERNLDDLLKKESTETLKKSLWDYVSRHDEKGDWLLPQAYSTLFVAIRDDAATSEEELLRVTRGMSKHPWGSASRGVALGALALADRNVGLREVEALVRERLSDLEENLAKEKADFKNEANYRQYLDEATGEMHDALGWVLLKQGRTAEAEKELVLARQLAPGQLVNLFHLGGLAESRRDLDQARRFYGECSTLPSRKENPCLPALRSLYENQHGSLEGFESTLETQQDRGRAIRRERLLADSLKPPMRLPPFRLKDLAGEEVSSDRLEGKIGVIDFWGVWCPGCKTAAPYFQKLVDKYRDEPEVVILSINTFDALPVVQKWIREEGLTFPVLRDAGYVTDHEDIIEAYPTTWFVDRGGHIIYIERGAEENLVEEFSWRIEALKRR